MPLRPFPACLAAGLPAARNAFRRAVCALPWLALPVFAAPPAPEYELLFEENFDGNAVNRAHWFHRTGPRTGTGIDGLNLERAVRIADGHLIVTATQETIDGRTANVGGGLISTHRFGYGYYEVRSQPFMGGRGVHVAFWQRGLGQENNSLFEIDSYELDSTQKLACNNLYVSISPAGTQELPWPHRANVPLQLPPDGWWIDAYEFTPDGVVFYDHGRVVARAEFNDLTAAQNVWLTALNGVGRVDADKLPGETRFDYFRFYARDFPGANLLPNGDFEYNLDKVDLQKPLAWTEVGDAAASRVVRGGAAHHAYKLRHDGSAGAYSVATRQTLEFIRNGDYELVARVRRSGAHRTARILVSDLGGASVTAEIPVTDEWREVHLPRVAVGRNTATIAVESAGGPGDWLEVDDLRFLKPALPGQPRREPPSFERKPEAPLWQLALRAPIAFTGDEKFYFFSRELGRGDAMTVSFRLRAETRQATFPLTRMPKTGAAGWGVRLGAAGEVALRIGTHAAFREVVARDAYRAGESVHVTCVYDHGEARVYLEGELRGRMAGFTAAPTDVTAAGRLGANSGLYDAVGDVTLLAEQAPATGAAAPVRHTNFRGSLGAVKIYNRVLTPAEIAADARAAQP